MVTRGLGECGRDSINLGRDCKVARSCNEGAARLQLTRRRNAQDISQHHSVITSPVPVAGIRAIVCIIPVGSQMSPPVGAANLPSGNIRQPRHLGVTALAAKVSSIIKWQSCCKPSLFLVLSVLR